MLGSRRKMVAKDKTTKVANAEAIKVKPMSPQPSSPLSLLSPLSPLSPPSVLSVPSPPLTDNNNKGYAMPYDDFVKIIDKFRIANNK